MNETDVMAQVREGNRQRERERDCGKEKEEWRKQNDRRPDEQR